MSAMMLSLIRLRAVRQESFSDIGQFTFDDGSQIYDVGFPDRFAAANGSVLAMDYIGGDSGGAAIQFDGGTPDRRVVMLGFPFETIVDSEVRGADHG